MSFETRAFGGMLLAIAAVVAALVYYEHRHPCLRYSTRRVFVPELTIYTEINGGTANAANGGMSIPVTTPAHYEDDLVCEERK